MNHLELFIKGSVIGQLVGDMIGLRQKPGYADEMEGCYTGIGALTLCTIASLNEMECVSPSDILEKFYDTHIGGYLSANPDFVEIGQTSTQAIKNHSNGMPPDKCGIQENNDGEVLARILPIGLFYKGHGDIIEASHSVCQITHKEIKSQVCCALYALLSSGIFLRSPVKVFDVLEKHYAGKDDYLDSLKSIKEWKNSNVCMGKNVPEDIFWSTWMAFSENSDYRSGIVAALGYGGHRSCTAGLTGGLMALSGGLNDIPAMWLNALKLSSEAMEVIDTFVGNVSSRQ